MKKLKVALAVAFMVVLLAPDPASAYPCSGFWHNPRNVDNRLQHCVVEHVSNVDKPTSWFPFAGGALLVGTAIAVWLLQKGRERVWRTEDEAWAELLGPGAI